MIKKDKDNYQFAIVGPSGRGKTYAFRNMDPETTGYINAENKPLPFKNNFKHYIKPGNWQETYNALIEFGKNDAIKVVVLDSFSSYLDSLLKTAREVKKGFETWNYYNEEIGKLLYLINKYPKEIFMTAHTDLVQTEEGVAEKRIGVKGNEWNKVGIEKNFTVVMYADVKLSDAKRDYFLVLNSDGTNSAKTPPMFFEGKDTIPNDCYEVLKEVQRVLE